MNVNNKKNGVKAENDIKTEGHVKVESDIKREDKKIIGNAGYFYIGKEYNLIDRIFQIGLVDDDLHLTNFSSQKPALINIADKYRVERNI